MRQSIQTGISFVVSGHIHEGLGALTKDGAEVNQNEYVSSLYLNPGPAKNGIFVVLTLNAAGGRLRAKYERHLSWGETGYAGLRG